MMKTVKLYTVKDLAKVLDVSETTTKYWIRYNVFPTPTAVYSTHNAFLWTAIQIEEAKAIYTEMMKMKAERKEAAIEAKKKFKENTTALVVDDEGLPTCSLCDEVAFSLDIHMQFAHKGKLSKVGAKQ